MRKQLRELRAAPRRARADHGARRQVGDRRAGRMNPCVARVAALEECDELELLGHDGGNVLEAVHRDVGIAPLQCLLELLDEQPLATDRGERDVLALIAGRLHRHELRLVTFGSKPPRDFTRLPERQVTAACCDADLHLNPKIFRIVRRSDSRSCGSSAASFSWRIG